MPKKPSQEADQGQKTIEQVPLADLIPYARNARTHSAAQISQLCGSLREFGWVNPVLIDGDNNIIAGHGRILAAQQLGMMTAPCLRISHLTDAQRRAYILADNSLALNSGWDEELLKIELADLQLAEFDVGLLGFSEEQLAAFDPNPPSDADAEPQIDKAEELRAKWGVETGQLWELGGHRILCGDSTKAEDVERVLAGDKPLLMVTDPPYGVEYDADWRNHAFRSDGSPTDGRAVGKVENDGRADWREAYELSGCDVAYVWHPPGAIQGEFLSSLSAAGYDVRMTIIWNKSNFAIGRGHYHVKHEPCFYAARKGAKNSAWIGGRDKSTVWDIPKPSKSETGHSTQKPVECMARPIRNHDSEFVYEPFSGSGTTIIACEQLGRKCRAIEISPAYVAVALQRWADATGKTPTLINA
jgi:DNA modification methylase